MLDLPANLIDTLRHAIDSATSPADLQGVRVHYLGKKGIITQQLKALGKLSPELRLEKGPLLHDLKSQAMQLLKAKHDALIAEAERAALKRDAIDVTLPSRTWATGHQHVVSKTKKELLTILRDLGYTYDDGPEIETEYFNFTALNMPEFHPARAMQDTFYMHDDLVLRTQTSSVQVRALRQQKLPLKMVAAGRVYRRDSDQTHTPMFHQLELLRVDESCHYAELKSLLTYVFKRFFGPDIEMRFRPSYFPFTEPSGELDILWGHREDGAPIWLEVAGFGMVHPRVLEAQDIDSERYMGFAFGVGLDRLSMLKYGIDDLRLLFQSDVNFLGQF